MEHLEQVDIDQQAKQHDYETAQPKNVIEKTTQGINAIVEAVENGRRGSCGCPKYSQELINSLKRVNFFNEIEALQVRAPCFLSKYLICVLKC